MGSCGLSFDLQTLQIKMTSSCFPWRSLLGKQKLYGGEEKQKQISSKRMKKQGPLEYLPKLDKSAMIFNWLENDDNEKDNNSYREDSDDNVSNDSDYYSEVNTKHRSFQNLHKFQIQEERRRGCLHHRNCQHNQKYININETPSINIYENRIWTPQTTLV